MIAYHAASTTSQGVKYLQVLLRNLHGSVQIIHGVSRAWATAGQPLTQNASAGYAAADRESTFCHGHPHLVVLIRLQQA